MDKKTALLGVLWLMALMAVGSVVSDQLSNAADSYGATQGFWHTHPDMAKQAHDYSIAVKSIGVAGLASIFSMFMSKKKKINPEQTI